MLNLRKNKKGSIQDLIYFGVVVLFFAMVILIGYKITNSIDTQVQSSVAVIAYDTDNYARTASTQLVSYYPGVIDNSFLIFAIGMALVTIILASLVRVHPIFIVFFFIGLVFVIFFSGIFSNIYQSMAEDPSLATEASNLIFIGKIMEYLPFITGIIGIILMVVMYKLRSDAA